MDVKKRAEIIIKWISDYCDKESYQPKSLVVGISGGITPPLLVLYVQKLDVKLLC